MNQLLDVSAGCVGAEQCLYRGKDLFLDIKITSHHNTEIGFPLAYLQKTGPIVRLIDTRTGTATYSRKNLADSALREEFTPILPGQSVTLHYVMTPDELEQFGGPSVDLFAEITVLADVSVSGKMVEFRGVDKLRIVSAEK